MFTGGKSKYASLLSLIRHESPVLYDVVSDLCLDGIFRSQRYETTFLMPNAKLVAHIKKLVDNDEDEKAIDAIRSLALKGHVKMSDFKSGASIGTLQAGSKVLAKPEEVAKSLKDSKKTFIVNKTGQVVNFIIDYNDEKPPATHEGKSGGFMPVGKSGGVAKVDEDKEAMGKLVKDFIVKDDHEKTLKHFFKAVAAVLNILENAEDGRYTRAKYYLAANPILSWFYLTMPGRGDALVKKEELKDLQWQSVVNPDEVITQAENHDYTLSKQIMGETKRARTQIINETDKKSMIPAIMKSYKELFEKHATDKVVDSINAMDKTELKLLMDENRYMYDSSINCEDSVSDVISAMKAIDWNRPADSLTMSNQEVHDKLKCVEAFTSGPVLFVKSVYFRYVPLTESVEKQLMEVMKGGAVEGANPATINSVMFSGGAARKALKKSGKNTSLASMVKTLSKAQREALKKML